MRPRLKLSFDQSIIIAFIAAVLLVTYLGYLALKGVDELEETARSVGHTQVMIAGLQSMQTEVEHAGTGVRGFVLTKNESYLAPFNEAQSMLPQEFQRLEDLSRENPRRQRDVVTLKDLARQYMDTLQKAISEQKQEPAAVEDTLEQSNDLLWQIGSYIHAIEADEQLLLASRTEGSAKSSQMEKLTLWIGSFSAVWIIVVSIVFLGLEMRSRRKLQLELAKDAELLKEMNRELEAFSYSVSHDLRAPLRHIHGFVRLLQKAPSIQADPSTREKLGVISGAAEKMGSLIDDLLAFSRASRTEMHTGMVDMSELVESARQEVMAEVGSRQVEWTIGLLPKVTGDAQLLRLVWINLLSNALKYTRPREVTRIEIAAQTDPWGETTFSVRDNGVGFDSRYKDKLFGVFQRLHREEEFEGTGIGLANVQRIVQRHGGKVWAEGEIGSGAILYFTLPSASTQRRPSLP